MENSNIYVLLGAPCSGKSSIGKKVSIILNMKYISSGDIARDMAKTNKKVSNDLIRGKLAPEEFMRRAVKDKIDNENNTMILDGFPRFQDQLEWITQNINNRQFIFIKIDVGYDTLSERASKRCRDDDISFNNRMGFYIYNTLPMINNIDEAGLVYHIDNTYNIEKSIHKIINIITQGGEYVNNSRI